MTTPTAAVEQVAAFIASHGASRFQPESGEAPTIVHNRAGFWRVDKMGEREYLIPAPIWREEVCRGLSPKAATAVLLSRGFLSPDGQGKGQQSVKLPGILPF